MKATRAAVRHRADAAFRVLALGTLLVALVTLAALVIDVLIDGAGRLDWQFLTSLASRRPADAGIYHALAGSIWVIVLTAALALPLGVASAVYLEESESSFVVCCPRAWAAVTSPAGGHFCNPDATTTRSGTNLLREQKIAPKSHQLPLMVLTLVADETTTCARPARPATIKTYCTPAFCGQFRTP